MSCPLGASSNVLPDSCSGDPCHPVVACMPALASMQLCDRHQWKFSHQLQVFIGSCCASGTRSQHLFALVNPKISILFLVTKCCSVSNFTSMSSSLRNPPMFWNATHNVVVCFSPLNYPTAALHFFGPRPLHPKLRKKCSWVVLHVQHYTGWGGPHPCPSCASLSCWLARFTSVASGLVLSCRDLRLGN